MSRAAAAPLAAGIGLLHLAHAAQRGCAGLACAGITMRACSYPAVQALAASDSQPAAADPRTKEWSMACINGSGRGSGQVAQMMATMGPASEAALAAATAAPAAP